MNEEKEKLNFLINLIKNLYAGFPECELSHNVKYINEPDKGTQAIPASEMKEFKLIINFWR